MIIISQDRCNILNFNTTINIGVEELSTLNIGAEELSTLNNTVEISAQTNGTTIVLGKYETEERAKEVLKQIYVAYGNINMLMIPKVEIHEAISANRMFNAICYKMPER